ILTRANNAGSDQPTEEPPRAATPSSLEPSANVRLARDIAMPAFSGHSQEDGKRWLDMFLCFAACHCWSSAYKLMFVVYYLRDAALVWFENQNFQLWESFVEGFRTVYGNDLRRARRAEKELRT